MLARPPKGFSTHVYRPAFKFPPLQFLETAQQGRHEPFLPFTASMEARYSHPRAQHSTASLDSTPAQLQLLGWPSAASGTYAGLRLHPRDLGAYVAFSDVTCLGSCTLSSFDCLWRSVAETECAQVKVAILTYAASFAQRPGVVR